jgi:adenylate cyclase class IV
MSHQEIERQYVLSKKKVDEIRKKLKTLGCKKVHDKILYHVVYFYMPRQKGFLRIREEGKDMITITRKIFKKDYADESEVKITNETFEHVVNLLRPLIPKQWNEVKVEKYREKWNTGPFKLCNEIVIDQWPGLPPYLELDCSNGKELDRFIEAIGLQHETYFTRGAFDVYMDLYKLKDKSILFKLSLEFKTIEKVLGKYLDSTHKKVLKTYC